MIVRMIKFHTHKKFNYNNNINKHSGLIYQILKIYKTRDKSLPNLICVQIFKFNPVYNYYGVRIKEYFKVRATQISYNFSNSSSQIRKLQSSCLGQFLDSRRERKYQLWLQGGETITSPHVPPMLTLSTSSLS